MTTGFLAAAGPCRRLAAPVGWSGSQARIEVGDMTGRAVRVERSGAVTTVFLHRPARRNAVDGPAAARLAAAFRAFDADPDAAVAVLHGEGGVFCSGADLTALGTERGNGTFEA
jgi:enoyl-CoA hydratase/carnithine racemase